MEDFETSLTDSEIVSEVRDALAGLDASKIPDDTILQTAKRYVTPLLNDNIPKRIKDNKLEYQDRFDSAMIAWTAELSFGAWLKFTRLRDREIETFIDPKDYKKDLEERTNLSLQLVESSRPPEIPNFSVAIKHDGVKRKVNLQQPWVFNKR